ncbi:hypothetical protein RclHR1_03380016 [Rhizophagus clarus]|uniref:Uncharacterized protein n=1 Tax=Rhizophagus clarus TaxID=94130 RepID=A0A2Z6RLB6_9GLOM|nr:hypothetical protein RclHR1_03380016 [Rhizophagus clarus]
MIAFSMTINRSQDGDEEEGVERGAVEEGGDNKNNKSRSILSKRSYDDNDVNVEGEDEALEEGEDSVEDSVEEGEDAVEEDEDSVEDSVEEGEDAVEEGGDNNNRISLKRAYNVVNVVDNEVEDELSSVKRSNIDDDVEVDNEVENVEGGDEALEEDVDNEVENVEGGDNNNRSSSSASLKWADTNDNIGDNEAKNVGGDDDNNNRNAFLKWADTDDNAVDNEVEDKSSSVNIDEDADADGGGGGGGGCGGEVVIMGNLLLNPKTKSTRKIKKLYDLWDKNYLVIESKKNSKYFTKVALGAYANPIYVSPNFKCILVMNEKKLASVESSFLSRFEKQKMSINDILNDRQKSLVENLEDWAKRMSTYIVANPVIKLLNKFTLKDLFVGFNKDGTLQSLVINTTKINPEAENNEILEKCKVCLIATATFGGILRVEQSALE